MSMITIDHPARSLRSSAAALARTLATTAAERLTELRNALRHQRAERDIEALADRLEMLNDRQLAMLGLRREGLYAQIVARAEAQRAEKRAA